MILYNKCKGLDVEGSSVGDNSPHRPDKLTKPNQEKPSPNIKTTSLKKKKWVLVVGDSSLHGTGSPICWTDPLLREGCCLPGAQVRKLPSLVWLTNHSPLVLFHIGRDEAATCRSRATRRDFMALEWQLKEFSAYIIFSSLPPVLGKDMETNRRILSLSTWLHGWCHHKNSGIFENQMAYVAPGMLTAQCVVEEITCKWLSKAALRILQIVMKRCRRKNEDRKWRLSQVNDFLY